MRRSRFGCCRAVAARRLARGLELRETLRAAEPGSALRVFGRSSGADPLVGQEWWLHNVGADWALVPGPAVPVVVDAGLDVRHRDFVGRRDTVELNRQQVKKRQDVHGTAVASVAAADQGQRRLLNGTDSWVSRPGPPGGAGGGAQAQRKLRLRWLFLGRHTRGVVGRTC